MSDNYRKSNSEYTGRSSEYTDFNSERRSGGTSQNRTSGQRNYSDQGQTSSRSSAYSRYRANSGNNAGRSQTDSGRQTDAYSRYRANSGNNAGRSQTDSGRQTDAYSRYRANSGNNAGRSQTDAYSRTRSYSGNSDSRSQTDYARKNPEVYDLDLSDNGERRKKNSFLWLIPVAVLVLLIGAAAAIYIIKPAWAADFINKSKNLLGIESESETETETEPLPEIPAYLASSGSTIAIYEYKVPGSRSAFEGLGGESGESEAAESGDISDTANDVAEGSEISYTSGRSTENIAISFTSGEVHEQLDKAAGAEYKNSAEAGGEAADLYNDTEDALEETATEDSHNEVDIADSGKNPAADSEGDPAVNLNEAAAAASEETETTEEYETDENGEPIIPEKEMIISELSLPRGTEVIFYDETILIGSDGTAISDDEENSEESEDATPASEEDSEEAAAENEDNSEAGTEYSHINYNGNDCYVLSENLTTDYDEIVKETTKFVRTSVTVYEDAETPKIASLIKKGEELAVTGFSGINEDGTVEMYKVTGQGADGRDAAGYVYSKYLADTKEEADAVYEEAYEIHKDSAYSYDLYGGSAANLDYFPYEKPAFEDNPLMEEAMSMYITYGSLAYIDDYLALAEGSNVNTFVVDIKDGAVAMELETTKELCPTAYSAAYYTADEYKAGIDKIIDAGYYVVGRIVVFNDSQFGEDHPETSLVSSYLSSYWPSAYSRDAWYYNIRMAIECVELFGFNEIQFDYVRFPEASYRMSQEAGCDFKNTYDEEKAEAIQNFLFYACDQVHQAGAYVSVDVFGECSDGYVTAYGQYWPAISNVVDAISGMPYVDHYGQTVDTWSDYYSTVYNWASNAAERQTEIPTPAVARTWITCYDVPYWNPTITCNSNMMISEIQALFDGGLTGGFMPWNGTSSLAKYYEVADCWSHSYY